MLHSQAAHAQSARPLDLSDLQRAALAGKQLVEPGKDVELRLRAMQEAAQSYGARGGLLKRSDEIRRSIVRVEPSLDALWNFVPLMLTDHQPGERADGRLRQVVPPVITTADSNFRQEGPTVIRIVGKVYRIESQARFASVPPTWRQYLYRDLGERAVTPPHSSLLPRTPEELARWKSWVEQGWAAGVAQADQYFESDLNRLSRDFGGMVLYHELVLQKMVSLPYVATANAGVTGDASTLNIQDSVLRITVLPAFSQESGNWAPVSY
jgi:defect-in-organelle-trafficking protein DotC